MTYTFAISIKGPDDNEGIISDDTAKRILLDLEEVVVAKGYWLEDSSVEED